MDFCRGIVPNISRLASSLRSAGGTVAWVLPGSSEPSALDVEFFGAETAAAFSRSGGEGPLRDAAVARVRGGRRRPAGGEDGASAFFPGRSPLPELLEERGIDTVLITGTVTNVCCESSARDASTLGYRVILVADANAARRDEDHNATLYTVYRTFGDVRTTADLIALIERDPHPRPPHRHAGRVRRADGSASSWTGQCWVSPRAWASTRRWRDATISASASTRPTQVAPSTDLPGSRSL